MALDGVGIARVVRGDFGPQVFGSGEVARED